MESEAVVMGDLALSLMLILPETLTTFFLALSFASLKKPKQVWWALMLAVLLLALEPFFNIWDGVAGSILHTLYVLLIYTSMVHFLFEGSILKAMSIEMLAALYTSVIEALFTAILFLIFSLEEQQAHEVISYCFAFMPTLIGLGLVILFYRWRSRRPFQREPDMTGWMLILLFSIPSYFEIHHLALTLWYDPNAGWLCFILSILLMFVCVGAFFLLDYSGRRQEADRENTVLRQNLKLETAHIESMASRYTHQRAQTHDFKNQLAVLRDMARRNVPQEEFSAYLDSMLEIDIPSVLYINTHRTVVDIVMSEKVPVAKEKGIDFQFQLDDLTDFPMPDDALVVVLTNLIDNAVEACGKIPQAADRHIWMRMKVEKRSALMCIDNTTAEPVAIQDNMVQTTKEDTLAHGYGLKNVAAMIERSGGMYFIEYDAADKKFRFTASLPMKTE